MVLRGYQSKARPVYGYNPEVNTGAEETLPNEVYQSRLENIIDFRYTEAFRRHGYKYARLNPVSTEESPLGGYISPCHRIFQKCGNFIL